MKKTIFITGATSGIGRACAELFAKQEFRLIICGRRKEILEELKNQLSAHTEVHTLNFDVRNYQDVKSAIASLPDEFAKIDVLVNNAGNAHGLDYLSEGKIEDWDAMIDGNIKGLLYVSKEIIPRMIEKRSGQIINISSIASRETYAKGVVYSATKKAVNVISEGMLIELAEHGIKVTNILPGATATDFSMVRFNGDKEKSDQVYAGYHALTAHDIADAIAYCVNVPLHVNIAELTVMPRAQASVTKIYKNKGF